MYCHQQAELLELVGMNSVCALFNLVYLGVLVGGVAASGQIAVVLMVVINLQGRVHVLHVGFVVIVLGLVAGGQSMLAVGRTL